MVINTTELENYLTTNSNIILLKTQYEDALVTENDMNKIQQSLIGLIQADAVKNIFSNLPKYIVESSTFEVDRLENVNYKTKSQRICSLTLNPTPRLEQTSLFSKVNKNTDKINYVEKAIINSCDYLKSNYKQVRKLSYESVSNNDVIKYVIELELR